MRRVREILRLKLACGGSDREIARSLKPAVADDAAGSSRVTDARRRWKRSGKRANLKQVWSHAKRNPLPRRPARSGASRRLSCRSYVLPLLLSGENRLPGGAEMLVPEIEEPVRRGWVRYQILHRSEDLEREPGGFTSRPILRSPVFTKFAQ